MGNRRKHKQPLRHHHGHWQDPLDCGGGAPPRWLLPRHHWHGELDVDLELYTFVTVMYMFLGVLYAVQKFMGKFADKDVVPILSTALFSALCAMMDYGNRCQDTAPTTEIEDNCNLILTGGIFHAFAALITMLAPILMGGGGNAVSAS